MTQQASFFSKFFWTPQMSGWSKESTFYEAFFKLHARPHKLLPLCCSSNPHSPVTLFEQLKELDALRGTLTGAPSAPDIKKYVEALRVLEPQVVGENIAFHKAWLIPPSSDNNNKKQVLFLTRRLSEELCLASLLAAHFLIEEKNWEEAALMYAQCETLKFAPIDIMRDACSLKFFWNRVSAHQQDRILGIFLKAVNVLSKPRHCTMHAPTVQFILFYILLPALSHISPTAGSMPRNLRNFLRILSQHPLAQPWQELLSKILRESNEVVKEEEENKDNDNDGKFRFDDAKRNGLLFEKFEEEGWRANSSKEEM